jgi:hypothetical protein
LCSRGQKKPLALFNTIMNLFLKLIFIASAAILGCTQTSSKNSGEISSDETPVDTIFSTVKPYIQLPIPDSLPRPIVAVEINLPKTRFKFGEEILVTITLQNNTKKVQIVYWDQPLNSMGEPAMTSVQILDKHSGKSVVQYDSWNLVSSDLINIEDIMKYSYRLQPFQHITNRFSLAKLAMLKAKDQNLPKGDYEMRIFYDSYGSNWIDFTVY